MFLGGRIVRLVLRCGMIALCLSLGSCRVWYNNKLNRARVEIPEQYTYEGGCKKVPCQWWTELNDPELNELIDIALHNNLNIKQAWSRLRESCANVIIASSDLIPHLFFNADAAHLRLEDGIDKNSRTFNEYRINVDLEYEIDLWRRLKSKSKSAQMDYCATWQDVEELALVLSGRVTNVWLTIKEQRGLLALFYEQIETFRSNLELIEMRFCAGEATALDVYQQRLQLVNAEEQPIIAMNILQNAYNELNVLLGRAPENEYPMTPQPVQFYLPEFPELGAPVDLFATRPDLKASFDRVLAADYDVAVAVADLYPKLVLSIDYNLKSCDIEDLFRKQLWCILGDVFYPIIDGGRRRAEVMKKKAILCRHLDGLYERFIVALKEIEDALSDEYYAKELLKQIQIELIAAEQTVNEATNRYLNGSSDYLPVIAAQRAQQILQRRQIIESKRLIATRARLYRALGGSVLCCQ